MTPHRILIHISRSEHREHAVNIARIRLLRLQADGRDWELKLEPPVNKVLSIARDRLAGLRAALVLSDNRSCAPHKGT